MQTLGIHGVASPQLGTPVLEQLRKPPFGSETPGFNLSSIPGGCVTLRKLLYLSEYVVSHPTTCEIMCTKCLGNICKCYSNNCETAASNTLAQGLSQQRPMGRSKAEANRLIDSKTRTSHKTRTALGTAGPEVHNDRDIH